MNQRDKHIEFIMSDLKERGEIPYGRILFMGAYTELIFGAELKRDVTDEVIDVLMGLIKWGINDHQVPFKGSRGCAVLNGSSEDFGVNESFRDLWFSEVTHRWHISTRSSIKNYDSEIENFLEWIKPFIDSGSGEREMYAIVTPSDGETKLYFLYD